MTPRDHGGNLDAAIARYGGAREDWLDLSTGINPAAYPVAALPEWAWTALPDDKAMRRLEGAARAFWNVPDGAEILAAPGASSLIAAMPQLTDADPIRIPGPTYNEHEAAFRAAGRTVTENGAARARILVQPNNPTGRIWTAGDLLPGGFNLVDESFCDTAPEHSLVRETARSDTLVLKSFGKFWGLAGLRLGFLIGPADAVAAMRRQLGPWSVSGPALHIGADALEDRSWADATRQRLAQDAAKLDALITPFARETCGTSLFRLYEVADARALQAGLAVHRIWTRIFPYSQSLIRLGLPHPDRWGQLQGALAAVAGR